MASNQYDSTSGSDPEERVFTRAVQNVERAKKNLNFEAATSIPAEAATDRRTRPSTSAQRPVTDDDVASPLSSYHDDSDVDKTVDPSQFSEDSSDGRSQRAQRRAEDRKKKQTGFSSGKSPCFYNNNYFHYGKFCIL